MRCFLCKRFFLTPSLLPVSLWIMLIFLTMFLITIIIFWSSWPSPMCFLLLLYGRHLDASAGLYVQWTSKIMPSSSLSTTNITNININNIITIALINPTVSKDISQPGQGPLGAWGWDDPRLLLSGRVTSMRRRRRRRRGRRRWTSDDNKERWSDPKTKMKIRKCVAHPLKSNHD